MNLKAILIKTLRTHYDNLKVARDAPDIVIRAAYKSLSQRFHPDKNLGDENAAKIMSFINRSYEVLSDPQKRAEHDIWIAREEGKQKKILTKLMQHLYMKNKKILKNQQEPDYQYPIYSKAYCFGHLN